MIHLERKTGYAILQLDRPDSYNIINSQMMRELNQHLDALERDRSVKVLILTGGLQVFAVGVDVKELLGNPGMIDATWHRLYDFTKPVIAAVAGYALGGGCELAQMCDIILAAEGAKFGQPEIKLSIMPGMGGTKMLAGYVGKSTAMRMCLTGETINAQQAMEYGLVSEVLPVEELLGAAEQLALDIARHSLPALIKIKREIKGTPLEFQSESHAFKSCFDTSDQREGMTAFLEKRIPKIIDA